ncbi:MAG: hypothetical protein CMA06_02100 [Euryarchaeota archaeon]|nr:hypothetical protein [Euryarchaeota archaeon]
MPNSTQHAWRSNGGALGGGSSGGPVGGGVVGGGRAGAGEGGGGGLTRSVESTLLISEAPGMPCPGLANVNAKSTVMPAMPARHPKNAMPRTAPPLFFFLHCSFEGRVRSHWPSFSSQSSLE